MANGVDGFVWRFFFHRSEAQEFTNILAGGRLLRGLFNKPEASVAYSYGIVLRDALGREDGNTRKVTSYELGISGSVIDTVEILVRMF